MQNNDKQIQCKMLLIALVIISFNACDDLFDIKIDPPTPKITPPNIDIKCEEMAPPAYCACLETNTVDYCKKQYIWNK